MRAYNDLPQVWFCETAEQFQNGLESALMGHRSEPGKAQPLETDLVDCAWNQAWEWTRQTVDDAISGPAPAPAFAYVQGRPVGLSA